MNGNVNKVLVMRCSNSEFSWSPMSMVCKWYQSCTGVFELIPVVLILNVHFRNYYITSRDYVREPPSNHLDLTSLELTLPLILVNNCYLYSHVLRQYNRTRGKACRSHERAPLPILSTT